MHPESAKDAGPEILEALKKKPELSHGAIPALGAIGPAAGEAGDALIRDHPMSMSLNCDFAVLTKRKYPFGGR